MQSSFRLGFKLLLVFFSALNIVGVGHLLAPTSGLLGGSTSGFVDLIEALMVKAEERLGPSALAAKVLLGLAYYQEIMANTSVGLKL